MCASVAPREASKEVADELRAAGEDPRPEPLKAGASASGWIMGAQRFDQILSLAKRVGLDWKGVGRWHSDEPLPFSFEYLEQLFTRVPEAVGACNMGYGQRST